MTTIGSHTTLTPLALRVIFCIVGFPGREIGMANELILTRDGVMKLEAELEDLKVNQRPAVVEQIKTARGFGDLSENAEYDAAKEKQGHIESRIREIEAMLSIAKVVDNDNVDTDAVSIGNTVKVFDMEYEEEDEYTVVGSTEADPAKLFVSNESPIGKALLGAHVGDVVDVDAPGGVIQLKILDISRAK